MNTGKMNLIRFEGQKELHPSIMRVEYKHCQGRLNKIFKVGSPYKIKGFK